MHKRKHFNLMVVRINPKMEIMESEPCSVCTKLIKRSGIGNVWYSTIGGTIIRCRSEELDGNHITKGYGSVDNISEISISSIRSLTRIRLI